MPRYALVWGDSDSCASSYFWKNSASGAPAGTSRGAAAAGVEAVVRSEEHTSELQSLMRISYAVFCLKKNNTTPLHIYRTLRLHAPEYVPALYYYMNRSLTLTLPS